MLSPKHYETGKYWTHGVNLVEGCATVSPGCDHCWSLAKEKRFHGGPLPVRFVGERLSRLGCGRTPRVVAVWNDLFHEAVPNAMQWHAFNAMNNPRHRYLVLTKRAEKMRSVVNEMLDVAWAESLDDHIWLGVTSEDQHYANKRIPELLDTRAGKRFASIEPILGRIDLTDIIQRRGISQDVINDPPAHLADVADPVLDWVVVGCETGHGARISQEIKNNILDIIWQCQDAGVPCWVKAIPVWTGKRWKASHNMSEWPDEFRVREVG